MSNIPKSTENEPASVIFDILEHVITKYSTAVEHVIEVRSDFANFKISIADDANAFVGIDSAYRYLYHTNRKNIQRKIHDKLKDPIILANDQIVMTYNDALEQAALRGKMSLRVSVVDVNGYLESLPYEDAIHDHGKKAFENVLYIYDIHMDDIQTVF